DHLASGDRAERVPDVTADGVLDVMDAAVGEEGIDAAGVVAAGLEGHVSRAAVVLVDVVPVHGDQLAVVAEGGGGAGELRGAVGRDRRGEARVVHAAVAPAGVADRAAVLRLAAIAAADLVV